MIYPLLVIADWEDDDHHVFLCFDDRVNQTYDQMKQLFEGSITNYKFTGFYCGINPDKYILYYGISKKKIKKYKKDIYDEELKKLRDMSRGFKSLFEDLLEKNALSNYPLWDDFHKMTEWIKPKL